MVFKEGFSKKKLYIAAACVFVLVLIVIVLSGRSGEQAVKTPTYTVARGDMTIKVTEAGTIKPRNPVEIRSEVEGDTAILSIVSEGTYITQEDVDKGRVIVELDTSQIKENLNQREISFNAEESRLIEARESYDIRVKQNDSDLQKGKLAVKFALMDLQKYLGEEFTGGLGISDDPNKMAEVNVAGLIEDPNKLGGESRQSYRELTNRIKLAEEDLQRASNDLVWTRKLFENDYVPQTDLKADEVKVMRLDIDLKQAQTSLDLFIRYEFPKQAQKLFSDYVEANRELERTEARCRSELAQARANLKSAEATYNLQKERVEKFRKQLEACTIKAPAPGLVVYESQFMMFGFRGGSRRGGGGMAVGDQVYQRQTLMRITNTSELAVDVKVHESSIDKVKIGQTVYITVDALPDTTFTGEVVKISILPDQQGGFMNPDLKVYATEVNVDGQSQTIKPGMSAKVDIIAAELKDVISVPVQAIANRDDKKVCYVQNSSRVTQRQVKTGMFNDAFVEVVDGLKEGEVVLLNPPQLYQSDSKQPARPGRPPNVRRQPNDVANQPSEGQALTGDAAPSNGAKPPEGMKIPEGMKLPDGMKKPENIRKIPEGTMPSDGARPSEGTRPSDGARGRRDRRYQPGGQTEPGKSEKKEETPVNDKS